jgi:hypothetical protein
MAHTTHLIVVDANDVTKFKYTDFATGSDANYYGIPRGDKLSWIVRSSGNIIGYRIDFNQVHLKKVGSPFQTNFDVVPHGGISTPQAVLTRASLGFFYTVTLNDLRTDDPQVEPYDELEGEKVLHSPIVILTIHVTVVSGQIRIDQVGPYQPLSLISWTCDDPTLVVDFSGSGRQPPSPFIDPSANTNSPLPASNGTTQGQQVRMAPGFRVTPTTSLLADSEPLSRLRSRSRAIPDCQNRAVLQPNALQQADPGNNVPWPERVGWSRLRECRCFAVASGKKLASATFGKIIDYRRVGAASHHAVLAKADFLAQGIPADEVPHMWSMF